MSYVPYKQGVFTPTVTLVGGAGNTVPVYATNIGRYVRIGQIVFVDIYLDGDGGAEGAGTGLINIALPFTAGASQLTDVMAAGHLHNNVNEDVAQVQVQPGATTAEVFIVTGPTSIAAADGGDQNNASRTIRLQFHYEV